MPETSWPQWQQQVLSKIRRDYAEILQHLTFDEVDWTAWRDLYDQGRSAADAVDYAFVREQPVAERRSKPPFY
ncbi:MAG: hypothetical protein AB7T07_11505 [Steroidobacteraceae bacterium]